MCDKQGFIQDFLLEIGDLGERNRRCALLMTATLICFV